MLAKSSKSSRSWILTWSLSKPHVEVLSKLEQQVEGLGVGVWTPECSWTRPPGWREVGKTGWGGRRDGKEGLPGPTPDQRVALCYVLFLGLNSAYV